MALGNVASWLGQPGSTEFVAAIVGAVVGSVSGGVISWLLQRQAFTKDKDDRMREAKLRDRSLLLQTLYACMQAASDQHKFAESAIEARAKLQKMQAPSYPGLSSSWIGLRPHASLPDPISIDPAALTVLVDHGQAELVMNALDVQAVHRSSLKTWSAFADSRRRFGEKVTVQVQNGVSFTAMSQEDVERLYPHLKELSDLADGLLDQSEQHAALANRTVTQLAALIEKKTGTKVSLKLPSLDAPETDAAEK